MTTEKRESLHKFIVAHLRRYAYEFELMAKVVDQSRKAFDDFNELMRRLLELQEWTEQLIDDHFEYIDVEMAPLAQVKVELEAPDAVEFDPDDVTIIEG